jgi:hypothetical protein
MEACPKLPMLNFDMKYSVDNGDFALRLKALIHVSENDKFVNSSKLTSE